MRCTSLSHLLHAWRRILTNFQYCHLKPKFAGHLYCSKTCGTQAATLCNVRSPWTRLSSTSLTSSPAFSTATRSRSSRTLSTAVKIAPISPTQAESQSVQPLLLGILLPVDNPKPRLGRRMLPQLKVFPWTLWQLPVCPSIFIPRRLVADPCARRRTGGPAAASSPSSAQWQQGQRSASSRAVE